MGPAPMHPTFNHTFLKKTRRVSVPYLRKDLEIRGIYLPYIGFFAVLGLFVWALKPYYPFAAFIMGMVGKSRGVERPGSYDNRSEMVRFQ